jgi:hypothetical protein
MGEHGCDATMARIDAWRRHDPQACLQEVAAVVEPRVAERRPRP